MRPCQRSKTEPAVIELDRKQIPLRKTLVGEQAVPDLAGAGAMIISAEAELVQSLAPDNAGVGGPDALVFRVVDHRHLCKIQIPAPAFRAIGPGGGSRPSCPKRRGSALVTVQPMFPCASPAIRFWCGMPIRCAISSASLTLPPAPTQARHAGSRQQGRARSSDKRACDRAVDADHRPPDALLNRERFRLATGPAQRSCTRLSSFGPSGVRYRFGLPSTGSRTTTSLVST